MPATLVLPGAPRWQALRSSSGRSAAKLLLFLSERGFPGRSPLTPRISGEGGLVLMPLLGLEAFLLAKSRRAFAAGLVTARLACVRLVPGLAVRPRRSLIRRWKVESVADEL